MRSVQVNGLESSRGYPWFVVSVTGIFSTAGEPTGRPKSIPWSGGKWSYFLGYTERSTITRLRSKSESDVVSMPSSYALC